ncbi:MAG: hypothetical protein ACLRXB_14625 [Escherichia coli]
MKHSCSWGHHAADGQAGSAEQSSNEELAALFYYLLNGSEHVTVRFCRRWRSGCHSTRAT